MWYFKLVEDKKIFNNYFGDGSLFGFYFVGYVKINFK